MDRDSVAQSPEQREDRRKRKCRTNRGRFMRLEAGYRNGALTREQRMAFEDVIRDLWRLERAAQS